MLVATGLDEAIIGVVRVKGRPDIVCYDYAACVALLMRKQGMSEEEAFEWMEVNVVDAYVGPETPAYLMTPEEEQNPREFVQEWADLESEGEAQAP